MTETQLISSTKKTTLQAIILTVISFIIFISLISFVSAIDFSYNIPEEMSISDEIEVSISVAEGNYDVKVFFESDDSEISGEIETQEGWKSSRYYIQDINFQSKSFNVKLKNPDSSLSNLNVCVRIRDYLSTSTPTKQCTPIELTKSSSSNSEQSNDSTTNTDTSTDSNNTDINQIENTETIKQSSSKKTPISVKQSSSSQSLEIQENQSLSLEQEPIFLTSKSKQDTIYTSAGKQKIWINYIASFCVLIILFLVLRSENRHREI